MNLVMGSRESNPNWSVFGSVKNFPPTPEILMAKCDVAISKHEYAKATAFLQSPSSLYSKAKSCNESSISQYDAQVADEAYRVRLASLAGGKLDEALHSLSAGLTRLLQTPSCNPSSLMSQMLQKPRR